MTHGTVGLVLSDIQKSFEANFWSVSCENSQVRVLSLQCQYDYIYVQQMQELT